MRSVDILLQLQFARDHHVINPSWCVPLQLEAEGVSVVLSTGPLVSDIPRARYDTPFALPVRIINAAQEVVTDDGAHEPGHDESQTKVRLGPVIYTAPLMNLCIAIPLHVDRPVHDTPMGHFLCSCAHRLCVLVRLRCHPPAKAATAPRAGSSRTCQLQLRRAGWCQCVTTPRGVNANAGAPSCRCVGWRCGWSGY